MAQCSTTCVTIVKQFENNLKMSSDLIFHPEAGTIDKISRNVVTPTAKGYMRIRLGDQFDYVHRLIWEHVNGPIPKGMHIDHINGVRDDNRIENLRLVTPKENMQHREFLKKQREQKKKPRWLDRGFKGETP